MKILLVDTNLISYAASKDKSLAQAVQQFLGDWSKDYELAVSAISRFELFQHSSLETAQKLKKFTDFLRTFDVSGDVLNVAAVLSTCYRKHETIKCRCDSISIADKIIGATALIERECYILTSDVNDFPRPFFTEHQTDFLAYQNGKHSIDVYVLKPDVAAYSRSFKACYPKKEK